ncbi:MAG: FtsX-like permease family protein, partial [Actinomycetota bacterium]|nr:FtsX-like permease family protein [Actinomycetota bacterium]
MSPAKPGTSADVAGDGGRAARTAMVRWAWRLFRREWREQILVLALLTLAVAASVGGAAAAYNLAPAAGNADFGSASHSIAFDESNPRAIRAVVAAVEQQLGTTDVIQRRFVSLPGLFDPVELREQSPDGPYSAPMLALLDGRYPSADGEVAVTDAAADTLQVEVGKTFALDGSDWTVVGTVENPSNFDDEFVLLAPTGDRPADSVTILVEGSDDQLSSFRGPDGISTTIAGRPANEDVAAAGGVLAVSTVLLMLVGLIAGAGFVVLAHRRLRQLGLLAAIGATERHLRVVMVANGAVVGAIAAVLGIVVALATWIAMVPTLETAVRHRIETFDVPWWLIGTGFVLAVATATGAAWLPARAIARTSVVDALSGRPPHPKAKRGSAVVAVLLVITGTVMLAVGRDPFQSWINALLLVGGTAALIVGILLLSPLAIQGLAVVRGRSSVAVRLAVGDLIRYRSRSGAALAAISLVLAMAAAIVISSSAALYASAAEGNLSNQQLLIRVGEIPGAGDVAPVPERTPAEIERLDDRVQEIATLLGQAAVIPVDVAVGPAMEG